LGFAGHHASPLRLRTAAPRGARWAKRGGARRDRTADLVIANDALSQLSYGPFRGGLAKEAADSGGHLSPRPGQVKKSRTGNAIPGRLKFAFSAPIGRWLPLFGPVGTGIQAIEAKIEAEISRMRAVLDIVLIVLDLYVWLLIASAILSWLIAFNVVNTRNQFVAAVAEFLYRITEPLLAPIRNILPNLGGLDISPIILILIIMFIERVITYYIYPAVF
jgi:YggT family protein